MIKKKKTRIQLFGLLVSALFAFTQQSSAQSYCEPAITTDDVVYINEVSFESILNPTGNDGYTYYPFDVATLVPGNSYTLSIATPNATTGTLKYFVAYIDYNDDGSFSGTGELVASGSTTAADFTASVTVPLYASNLLTRLRVGVSTVPIAGPCIGDFNEVEDYPIITEGVGDDDWDIWVVDSGYEMAPPVGQGECQIKWNIGAELEDCVTPGNGQFVTVGGTLEPWTTQPSWVEQQRANVPPVLLGGGSSFTNNFPMYLHGPNNAPLATGYYKLIAWHNYGSRDEECAVSSTSDSLLVIFYFGSCEGLDIVHQGPYKEGMDEDLGRIIDEGTPEIKAIREEKTDFYLAPNPAKEQISLGYQMEEDGWIHVNLMDQLGRTTTLWQDPSLQKGFHELQFDVSDFTAGLYWLTIETEVAINSHRLLLMR